MAIDITDKVNFKMYKLHSPFLSMALPMLHALSGCDTTSSLYYLGKNTVFDAVTKDESLCDEIANEFGETVEASVDVARQFISHLYDPKGKLSTSHEDKGSELS